MSQLDKLLFICVPDEETPLEQIKDTRSCKYRGRTLNTFIALVDYFIMILAESHFSIYIIYQKDFDHLCNILRKKKKGIVLERETYTTRRLKSFPWDALVYQRKHNGVLSEFGKIREIGMYHVMCIDEQVTCTGWLNVLITEFSIQLSVVARMELILF